MPHVYLRMISMDPSSYITHYLTSPISSLYIQLQMAMLKKPVNKALVVDKKNLFINRLELYRLYLESQKALSQTEIVELDTTSIHPSIKNKHKIVSIDSLIPSSIITTYIQLHPDTTITNKTKDNTMFLLLNNVTDSTDDAIFEQWLVKESFKLMKPTVIQQTQCYLDVDFIHSLL
jgi:hypothetical protein